VGDGLARFHDADNSSIDLELSVLEDSLVGRGILLRSFLELDCIDFDPRQWGGELIIEREFVRFRHVLGLWMFREHTVFSTCQRLQSSVEFLGFWKNECFKSRRVLHVSGYDLENHLLVIAEDIAYRYSSIA